MSHEHRDVIDRQEAAQLPDDNPNLAAGKGDYNHENFIGGDDVDDDGGVAEAGRAHDAAGTSDQAAF